MGDFEVTTQELAEALMNKKWVQSKRFRGPSVAKSHIEGDGKRKGVIRG